MVARELVGHAAARAVLRDAIDALRGGRGGLVLVSGEPGIGKTSLVSHATAQAGDRGFRLLWATCWDGAGAPAYWPWVQVIRSHVQACDPAVLRAQLGTGAGEVARLVDEVDEVVDDVAMPAADTDRDPDRARFQLLNAVSSFLLRVASDRPLCVVLDDLQWADAATLSLLGFLARLLPTSAVLVIGCYRDTEVGPGHPLRALRGEVGSDTEVVELTGLDLPQVASLIRDVARMDPGPELVEQVHARTGGNPFFVREVTRLLAGRGDLTRRSAWSAGLPDGVRHVVERRLARLSEPCTALLAVAAVTGQEVSRAVLARATGFSAGTVTELIGIAVETGMLVEVAASGPYRFGHDLIRETVHHGLTSPRRAVLHLRVGTALEQLRSDGATVTTAELAHHFLLAAVGADGGRGPEAGTALRYCTAAAADACGMLAYEDAASHLQRALDGLGGAGLLDELQRLDLLLGRADALRHAGELQAARLNYQQVIELARGCGQPARLARAALGVQGLGVESGSTRDGCIRLLEDALDVLPDESSALKAQVLACLAREVYLSDVEERPRAVRLSDAAAEMARRVGDDATLAMCLLAAHDTLWLPGTARARREIAVEMAAAARRAGDRAFEAEAWLLRASAGLELGDPGARADLDEFVRLGNAVGQPHLTYLVLTRRATRASMDGDFARAELLITEADQLAESIGEPDAWNVQTRLWWELRSAQGRRAETEPRLHDVSLPHLKFWYQALLGLALIERGEPAAALRVIEPAVQVRPEELPFPYVVAAQWAELGEAAAAAGLLDACARYYRALRPLAGTAVVIAAAVGFGGAVDHHLGILAAALGHTDDAVGHFARAADMHKRLGARPWSALTHIEWATALHHRGRAADRGQIADLTGRARSAADELGMAQVIARSGELAQPAPSVFHRDGRIWTLSYAGAEVQLTDAKGLRDLAVLLGAPGRDVPATKLMDPDRVRAPSRAAFGADPVLDPTARARYRARLTILDEAITQADEDGDAQRSTAAVREREILIRELNAAVGLGGRPRRLGDDAERARKAVTARIRDSLAHIDARHPALGAHLRESITTGLSCRYAPPQPETWRL